MGARHPVAVRVFRAARRRVTGDGTGGLPTRRRPDSGRIPMRIPVTAWRAPTAPSPRETCPVGLLRALAGGAAGERHPVGVADLAGVARRDGRRRRRAVCETGNLPPARSPGRDTCLPGNPTDDGVAQQWPGARRADADPGGPGQRHVRRRCPGDCRQDLRDQRWQSRRLGVHRAVPAFPVFGSDRGRHHRPCATPDARGNDAGVVGQTARPGKAASQGAVDVAGVGRRAQDGNSACARSLPADHARTRHAALPDPAATDTAFVTRNLGNARSCHPLRWLPSRSPGWQG